MAVLMSYGDSGDEVVELQLLLISLGYPIEATGTYDRATQQAVQRLQVTLFTPDNGIQANGRWDDLTAKMATGQDAPPGNPPVLAPPAPLTDQQITDQAAVDAADLDQNAFALLQRVLADLGLGELTEWAKLELLAGRSADEILLSLEELPEYKARFAGMDDRLNNGYNAIDAKTYLALEDSYKSIMRKSGLPAGFWDSNDDFQNLIANDISPNELQDRIDGAYNRVAEADPLVRSAFGEFFGIYGDSALAALVLDPDTAVSKLQNMAAQAEVAGAGRKLSFKINLPLAEELQRAGFSAANAPELFVSAAEKRNLAREQVGEREDITETGVVKAEAGLDERQPLETRLRRRMAKGQSTGGARIDQEGQSLGAANQ